MKELSAGEFAMYQQNGGPSPKGRKVVGDGGMKDRCKVVRHRPLRGRRNWISLSRAAGSRGDKSDVGRL